MLWSFSASFATFLKDLPTFEVLTVTFCSGFLFCLYKAYRNNKLSQLKQPLYVWIVGFVGICGQQMFYVLSFKYAPPVQADLVIYTWPIMVVLFSQFMQKRKNYRRTLVSALIGFGGVFLLFLAEPTEATGVSLSALLGYAFAFLCAVTWSLYTVLSRKFNAPSEMVGFYSLLGAAVFAVAHLGIEETVAPSFVQWVTMTLMGLTCAGMGYYCWDLGIKKGNFQLLSILSYTNPILSILWLYLFGLGELHIVIAVSTVLIIVGAFWGGVTSDQWRYFLDGVQHVKFLVRLKDRRSVTTVLRQQRVTHGDYVNKKRRKTPLSKYKRRWFPPLKSMEKSNSD